jgi:hypothetical protein
MLRFTHLQEQSIMRLKLFIVLVVALGYLAVLVACNRSSSTNALTKESNANANSSTAANANTAASNISDYTSTTAPVADGDTSSHAVDTSGKAIPAESATQPDKPIILAKDIDDPKYGELKPEAAFDHVKHSTDVMYSLDGKTITTCAECHHTEQPVPVAGQPYLKKSERKELLTAKQLETSKQPVKSCRDCHLSPASDETDEFPPQSVTYPKETGKPPSGKLTNDVAYHSKCISCHDAAKKRDPQLKSPLTCTECHTKK